MKRDLGYRRVQCTGRGSYIVSLPKDWVKDIGLERGSEVAFKTQDDLSLVLVPRTIIEGKKEVDKPKQREYWVIVEPRENPQSVVRKIISLYVVSADLIHIRFKVGEQAAKYKVAIANLVRSALLGSEIIDETPEEITLQILVSHPEFPVEKAIRRMAVIALLASKEAILALKNLDQFSIQSVTDACNDVNRLNLYVIRQLKFGLEQNLFKELGFRSPKEFLGYRIVANDIKNIADNAMNLANNVMTFKRLVKEQLLFLKETIDEEVYSQIFEFNSSAHQLFEESLKAMFKRDYEQADRIMAKVESFDTIENDLITLISTKKMDPNASSIFRLILDSSRRVLENSRNVAEVTLNRTVEEISTIEPL